VSALLTDDPFDLLAQIETRVRSARLDATAGQAQVWVGLGFRLGERWLAAPKEDVREVITLPPLTRVPGAKPWLLGLANVRGNLLPVCDLRLLMNQPNPTTATRNTRVLVYNSLRVPAGFLVDEVAGYRQFAASEQQRDLLSGVDVALRECALGAFQRDAQAWIALSLHKVAAGDAFQQAGVA